MVMMLLNRLLKGRVSGLIIRNRGRNISTSKLNSARDEKSSLKETIDQGPIKFTTSDAYINYKASRHFYGDDRELPPSHNIMLSSVGIFGIIYLFLLRDDPDAEGPQALFKPVHETVPELAIPLLKSAIAQNRAIGYNTQKLEQKLGELLKEPEKHGLKKPKLVEN